MSTKEEAEFFATYLAPELALIQGKTGPLPHPPDIEGDPLDLTPEEEAKIYQEILKLRAAAVKVCAPAVLEEPLTERKYNNEDLP